MLSPELRCVHLSRRNRFRTFVTEQKTLLFTQVAILMGLVIQIGLFFALLYYGRPPSTEYALVLQFFVVAAVWVLTINIGVLLFWWVSARAEWPIFVEAECDDDDDKEEESSTY